MKLIIQIPCLNEAETLPLVLAQLPTAVAGFDEVEILVIDDGSEDDTVAIAETCGVDHIVRHTRNLGLAKAFQTGIEACLRLGADVIVNTDGDNQYPATAVPQLVQPVLAGTADIAIGDRQVQTIAHFSPLKKQFQRLGSSFIRNISGTEVVDAVSGFRAYSREAALRLTVLSKFSYTLDTIIQAGKMGLTIASIPIETNHPTRPSRLQRSMWHFIKAQASTVLRLYAFYEPLKTFSYIAAPFLLMGFLLLGRFSLTYLLTGEDRFEQSVSIGIGLFVVGVLIFLVGVQADIASKHRQLTQEILYRLKKAELDRHKMPKNK